jgi:hypothetical protein
VPRARKRSKVHLKAETRPIDGHSPNRAFIRGNGLGGLNVFGSRIAFGQELTGKRIHH